MLFKNIVYSIKQKTGIFCRYELPPPIVHDLYDAVCESWNSTVKEQGHSDMHVTLVTHMTCNNVHHVVVDSTGSMCFKFYLLCVLTFIGWHATYERKNVYQPDDGTFKFSERCSQEIK